MNPENKEIPTKVPYPIDVKELSVKIRTKNCQGTYIAEVIWQGDDCPYQYRTITEKGHYDDTMDDLAQELKRRGIVLNHNKPSRLYGMKEEE